MRDLFRLADADHAGYSLQRMKAPKQILERKPAATRLIYETLESEQIAAYDRQMLIALREIIFEELVDEFTIRFRFGSRHDQVLIILNSATRALVMPGRSARRVWSNMQPLHNSKPRSGWNGHLL